MGYAKNWFDSRYISFWDLDFDHVYNYSPTLEKRLRQNKLTRSKTNVI